MSDTPAPALKEMFDAARYRRIATDVAAVYSGFDRRRFLALTLPGLEPLALLQRLRRATEALRATLPEDFGKAVALLRESAPRWESGFTTLVLPDFVGLYGREDFDRSLDALKFFTRFGSSEFAIREFLRLDLARTLREMRKWTRDDNEHVRRLASEGCRPRLPWSFRLRELIADPAPVTPILEALRADPSLYVRKSVANHLNDITKDHPSWVLALVTPWDASQPATAWIIRHGLRTLIKKGDRRALAAIGAGEVAAVRIESFAVSPQRIHLGEDLAIACALVSTGSRPQRLVIDYAIHYVKQSGASSVKVFKWKEAILSPGTRLELRKLQRIRDFSTRRHHPGAHQVDLLVNGERLARGRFQLVVPR